MTKRRRKRPRRFWTPAEDRLLRKLYRTELIEEICRQLDRPRSSVYQRAAFLGLRRSKKFLREFGAQFRKGVRSSPATEFKPGQAPANKGLRRPGYAPGRMRETQFKAGRKPRENANYLPIGSVRVTTDGILERKVTDDQSIYPARRWVAVARLVWEAAHGPIPPGCAVVFRPGCRTIIEAEITLDRLELVTRAELMRRNTIHHLPPAVADTVRLLGRVRRAIRKREGRAQRDG